MESVIKWLLIFTFIFNLVMILKVVDVGRKEMSLQDERVYRIDGKWKNKKDQEKRNKVSI